MSAENVKAYLKAMTMDLPEFEKLMQSNSVQDTHDHADSMGYAFTTEELAGVLIEIHQGKWSPVEGKSFDGALSLDELESVAGGGTLILGEGENEALMALLKSIAGSLVH